MLDGRRLAEQVVMFIFDAIGFEELFQSPATESTRLGIDLYIHGHTAFLPSQRLPVSYHGTALCGMSRQLVERLALGYNPSERNGNCHSRGGL